MLETGALWSTCKASPTTSDASWWVCTSERILIGHGSFYVILSSVYTVIYKIMYVRLHTSFKGYIVIHINKHDDDTISYDNNDYIHLYSFKLFLNDTLIHMIAESFLLFFILYSLSMLSFL